MGCPRMEEPVRRLLDGMLAEHGIDARPLYADVPLGDRLRLSDHDGRVQISPGPRFLASGHRTDDPARDVRLHWAALVAGALRRQAYGADAPMHAYLVPAAARAIALAAGWTPEGMVGACYRNAHPKVPPGDTPWCRNSERVRGQSLNELNVGKRHETPDWFLHLKVGMNFSTDFAIAYADHRSIRLRERLPAQLVAALPGRRLHEVVTLPGIEAGTVAGDLVIAEAHETVITLPQAWVPAADPPPGEDMRWMDVALQAPFANDDGSKQLN